MQPITAPEGPFRKSPQSLGIPPTQRSLFAVCKVGHIGQLVIEHDARSMNSEMTGADAVPSHVWRHVGWVGRQVATHVAIGVQAVSLGQLVGFRQQLAAMHAMHDVVALLKISAAPGHDVASPVAPIVPSSAKPPSPWADGPPPVAPAVQGTPFTSMHPPGIGGLGELSDEHDAIATSNARPAAIAEMNRDAADRRPWPAAGLRSLRCDRPREGMIQIGRAHV